MTEKIEEFVRKHNEKAEARRQKAERLNDELYEQSFRGSDVLKFSSDDYMQAMTEYAFPLASALNKAMQRINWLEIRLHNARKLWLEALPKQDADRYVWWNEGGGDTQTRLPPEWWAFESTIEAQLNDQAADQ